ncbi:MAG: exodeoxyribonuclease VII small subunit [Phycisphaerae bacterium]|nr:exodeoxyribonuclease VII small subunit [Phycisphaerae bacterium]
MSKKQKKPEEMSFEEAANELDGIIEGIDKGEDDLETMMASHARGQLLVKRCQSLLEQAEQQLKTVDVEELDE